MGTLRFDLNSLATAKAGKEEKKKALALRKDFIRSVSTAAAGSGQRGWLSCACCCCASAVSAAVPSRSHLNMQRRKDIKWLLQCRFVSSIGKRACRSRSA